MMQSDATIPEPVDPAGVERAAPADRQPVTHSPPTAAELEARAALGGPVVSLRMVAEELKSISYGQLRGWVDRSEGGALPGGIPVFQPGPQRTRYILRADIARLKGLLDE